MAKDLGRGHLVTELRNQASMDIDTKSVRECVEIIHDQDKVCVAAIEPVLDQIVQATEFVVEAFKKGGRFIYTGAGTSGRLGVLDASECPPTFGVSPLMVQGVIAGGDIALRNAVEGAEDSAEDGAREIEDRVEPKGLTDKDVVMGIATGGTTPYVRGALAQAKKKGCKTIFFCCVKDEDVPSPENIDVVINPIVGPEVVTGSTRLKAGTATKLVLNTITTSAMIQMGKTYGNIMVDLKATNVKLVDRSNRIVRMTTDMEDIDEVDALIKRAGGSVKTAIIMAAADCTREDAEQMLEKANGFTRRAIEMLKAKRGN